MKARQGGRVREATVGPILRDGVVTRTKDRESVHTAAITQHRRTEGVMSGRAQLNESIQIKVQSRKAARKPHVVEGDARGRRASPLTTAGDGGNFRRSRNLLEEIDVSYWSMPKLHDCAMLAQLDCQHSNASAYETEYVTVRGGSEPEPGASGSELWYLISQYSIEGDLQARGTLTIDVKTLQSCWVCRAGIPEKEGPERFTFRPMATERPYMVMAHNPQTLFEEQYKATRPAFWL
ncbi:hypothetical protein BC827DRAFT_1157975 [Russula dissimulans]|nr:hypothetical protein BC827DRAFT_1157975 [Russula dissimulans]